MNRLGDLDIYRTSLSLSEKGWVIHQSIPQVYRYDISSQFIRALDSIGANIAEGFGRYHYNDSIKFYYNARGSLWESKHWLYLLFKRRFIDKDTFDNFIYDIEILGKQLNQFINRLKDAK